MRVPNYINARLGALLITIRKCRIGIDGYAEGVIFRVIAKSNTNTNSIKIQEVSGNLRVEWVDVGTDERRGTHRLRFLYSNEVRNAQNLR